MITPKKILIVDDEPKIVEVVASYLEHNGYQVITAYSGKDGLHCYRDKNPALIILDLMLPDLSGEEICKIIRRESRVPIIMLTAKVEENDVLLGLDIGADDYVTKPFSPKQLIARVTAVLRRTSEDPTPLANILSFNQEDLVIDQQKYEVKKGGEVVSLTPKEYKILMSLIKYPNKAFTREELITVALGEDFDGFDRTIDTHIKNLRQKIEDDPKTPSYILTVYGIGYRFGGK